ncbi:hypothetical protein M408DRAFT_317912 [Serendipita vermifera MAFF 305830]|uniref:peptidyl-tRNA hydrolase n=1 Tax=Serendipita vermifera MAFF 305830 TaxID=933852 RepID=A0A0C2XRX7_SERVB|nr:hypothetical protein M408DRAFT_317912 [Serendipita vermifera MAFF 305830]
MLIFGLGNLPYPKSRHSVGQLIIEGLAARFGTRLAYEPKLEAFHASVEGLEMPGSPNNKRLKISLAKSKNLMNISGPSVKRTYDSVLHHTQTFHPRNRRVIIIHDSIDQAPFKISPRFGGSARGHNGVRSVIASLGTQDFYRIRIGVGAPTQRGVLEQFVLGRLSPEELEYWQPGGEGIERVWEAVVKIIQDECVTFASSKKAF